MPHHRTHLSQTLAKICTCLQQNEGCDCFWELTGSCHQSGASQALKHPLINWTIIDKPAAEHLCACCCMMLQHRHAAITQSGSKQRKVTRKADVKRQKRGKHVLMGAAQSSQGSSVDPCVTCRTYRTCVNSSGSSKAASGQSTHIKWADSTADEAQARRAVHSCVCLLVGISMRASGLMEDTQPSSDLSANVGESGVSRWTPEPMETSPFNPPPPPPLYRSFLVSEDKLSFSPDCISQAKHPLSV